MNFFSVALFLIDLGGTIAGVYATRVWSLNGKFMTLSGGLMLGIGMFWVWPDLAHSTGLIHSLLSVIVTVACLYAVDRYLCPICPCCTGSGKHSCHVQKAAIVPLAAAICIHNAFDGFCAGITGHVGANAGSGIVAGLLAHKVPEGLLFGIMLRSAADSARIALRSVVLTAGTIFLGAAAHDVLPFLSAQNVIYSSLALACGSFLFIGVHIAIQQSRDFGLRSAFVSTGLGIACAVMIERGTALLLT